MKHIRNILLLITIIFAFVMQAEVYQNMLWNFNGAYYLSSRYTTTNDDMDSFLANAEDIAEKHGVHMTNIVNSTLPTPNNHSEKNKPDGVFVIKQGKTNYKVKVFFDHSSGLTAEDRLKRIIQAEAERESA